MGNNDSGEIRLAILERVLKEIEEKTDLKIGRIVADIESEKGTRARLHEEWRRDVISVKDRLSTMERHVWIGVGIIGALQVLGPVIAKMLKLP